MLSTTPEKEHHIPMQDCKNRYFYKIDARNAIYGIYVEKLRGFIIIRSKWGNESLFLEFHWDTGPPYGTVKPLELVGETEFTEDDLISFEGASYDKIFNYLKSKGE